MTKLLHCWLWEKREGRRFIVGTISSCLSVCFWAYNIYNTYDQRNTRPCSIISSDTIDIPLPTDNLLNSFKSWTIIELLILKLKINLCVHSFSYVFFYWQRISVFLNALTYGKNAEIIFINLLVKTYIEEIEALQCI